MDHMEAYWFGRVHAAICDGRVAFASIDLGRPPLRNHDVDGNQAIIDAAKPSLRVLFMPAHGGSGDAGDGTVSWDGPIEMHTASDGMVTVGPGSMPLEVGTTSATTTFRHLVANGDSVARWPYGSTRLWLLLRVGDRRESAAI
jgi:hypothetical protein